MAYKGVNIKSLNMKEISVEKMHVAELEDIYKKLEYAPLMLDVISYYLYKELDNKLYNWTLMEEILFKGV